MTKAAEQIVTKKATVKGGRLNIREKKSTSSTIIGVLEDGAQIEIIEANKTWCELADHTGYVMRKYLAIEEV